MNELDRETMHTLLREIRKVASHASMTGSLSKGTKILVDVYNRCLTTLSEKGDALAGSLFPKLDPENTKIDEIGAASALLAAYLRRGSEDDRDE